MVVARTAVRRAIALVTVLLAALAGCGGSSGGTSTQSAELKARRDAFVSFYQAFIADSPARVNSARAAGALRAGVTNGHFNGAAVGRSLRELTEDAEAWKRSMEALPATNADLLPVRRKWVEAARLEAAYYRVYAAFLIGTVKTHTVNKEVAARVEAAKSKLQSLNNEAGNELTTLGESLGGNAVFHGRIDIKRLEELKAQEREAAGLSK